jgi:hypothetical protein
LIRLIGRIFGYRRDAHVSEGAGAGDVTYGESPENPRTDIGERIAKLDDLLKKRLITGQEYKERKSRILDEI